MPHPINPALQPNTLKISILGAAGGIGQSLSLLLKTQLHFPLKTNSTQRDKNHIHLALYDVNEDAINGVVADLSHIDTPVSISNHSPATGIKDCLMNSSLVIIPAGMPRKPGMNREDLFNINAKIMSNLTDDIAKYCDLSKVFVLIISNPVNSLVPVMVNRLWHKHQDVSKNTHIERRIMGVTKLDIVRAKTFLHEVTIDADITPRSNDMPDVPVIGGHSGETIMPLFSQSRSYKSLDKDQLAYLIHRVQYGGDEVVKAKNGLGSATLSMAHAGFKVVNKFVSLLLGNVSEIHGICYVSLLDSEGHPTAMGMEKLLPLIDNCAFFSIPMTITKKGVTSVDYDIVDRMDDHERNEMLPLCLPKLKKSVETGSKFAIEN
ncbi:malate dehydrogenase MDH2 NDAI_0G03940 [Naumovozyma dairenensis CBS 421]|uniref:Malate dehydrogenase n=1 Tax=Naumovozyma dairenensis (strain ATCC 10597 / BCRC 20456 / CBS 421 / NBRC 0211 / NRRL Y-12639) TaxID=1071378 RepID=G0WEG0_NAUDC|nr:hypothetical protein NDAI_0G03940 [Naumovozyma dairenensis CBS 421]CCD26171.2 hypothetical protein NDAI_0G03940 [Naumovozyma dairenensis CBS 421]